MQTLPVAIQGRLKPGRKLNCYWCSTQRRKELLDYARSRGFTKVALGHHLDDILETLFMNMAYKAEVGTMLPVMVYDRHDAVVIRPLTYVTNEQTLAYARSRGFLSEAAVCPFGTTSLRLKAREAVRVLASGGPGVRENLLKSLSAVRDRYLPGWHGQSDPPTRLPPDGDLLER